MGANSFGKMITMTSFGESHGTAIGVVLDGIPPKLHFSREDLQNTLNLRAPGKKGTSSRLELDQCEILSGIFDGKTLGTPIAVIVRNTNQRSKDYSPDLYRPGHADRSTIQKYGIRDYRGGGRASGRETIARVIGGYFAGLILPQINIQADIKNIGPLTNFDFIQDFLVDAQKKGESFGGQVKFTMTNVPPGLGEPVFSKLKSDLAQAIMSIGAIMSFEIGLGTQFAHKKGTSVRPEDFGGIEGGISNGSPIVLKVTFKPTSTVGETARKGRHDPCIIPRAIIVVKSMIHWVLSDHYLRQKALM